MVETGRTQVGCRRPTASSAAGSPGILGAATSLAFTGTVQTGAPLVGALIFPVGLSSSFFLGLDLVTGSFGLLPLPWVDGDAEPHMLDELVLGVPRQSDRQRRLWRRCWRLR